MPDTAVMCQGPTVAPRTLSQQDLHRDGRFTNEYSSCGYTKHFGGLGETDNFMSPCTLHFEDPITYNNWSYETGKTRTRNQYRVVYSDHQRHELEREYSQNKYITLSRKAGIASVLGLTERQVKVWFQNRRAKERKQKNKEVNLDTVPYIDHIWSTTNSLEYHHPQPEHSPEQQHQLLSSLGVKEGSGFNFLVRQNSTFFQEAGTISHQTPPTYLHRYTPVSNIDGLSFTCQNHTH